MIKIEKYIKENPNGCKGLNQQDQRLGDGKRENEGEESIKGKEKEISQG